MTVFGDAANASRSDNNSVNQSATQGTVADVGGLDTVVTTMSVQSGEGLNFVPGQIIKIGSSAEIIVISSISGDTFTIARGQYGSTATTHAQNDAVSGAGVGGNTTLDANITTTGTETITVGDTSAMVAGNMIKIDNEYMVIGVVASGTTLTIDSTGRGYSNSTAATHTSGATVTGVYIGTRDQNSQPWVQTSLTSSVAGTEYYQFSNDGTNWSQYPVRGFEVAANNIHEFHQAIKGKRYFRVRFENGGTTATTSFNVYSYFGVFNNGMLPLSQGLGSDQDAMVVRSVGVGEKPDGSFGNTLQDGSAYRTTSNLAGTKISVGQSLTATALGAQAIFDDVSGFGDSGFVYIGSEYIEYTSKDTGTTPDTLTLTFQLNLTAIGSGYTDGTYTNVATTTSGGGTNLTLDIVISNNVIRSFRINTRGSGYAVNDTITPDSATLGGGSGGQLTVVRGAFGSTSAAHAAEAVVGEVYNSGVLTLEGYTQVATRLLSSNTARQRFQWFSDSYGSDTIRTIAPLYPPDGGSVGDYDYLAAPAFGPYVRYIIANTDTNGNATTDLYFETEFYTKSISAQVLTVNSTILGAMTTNLTRSVTVGKQPDGDYVNLPADGSGFATTTNLLASATLNNGGVLAAGATSMTVTSDPGYSIGDYVRIEDEYIKITVVSATPTFTIERGQLGSSDVEHADSTAIYHTYVSDTPSGVTGDFLDTDGYNTISLFVSSDQLSLTDGIVFQFTDDSQASPPVVRGTKVYSYTSDSVTDGQRIIAVTTLLDGFRVLYTNGATATTNFIIEASLKTNAAQNKTKLDQTLQADTDVTDVRAVIAAQNPQSRYQNITTSIDSALDVSVLNPNTAFGELATARLTPFIQQQFTYYNGTMSTNNLFSIKLSEGGEVNGGNGQMTLNSNTNQGSHAIYQSLKLTKYRPGQGTRFRGTVSFSPSRSGLIQVFGFGDSSSGFFFKDSGSGMTTIRRTGGKKEIQKLEIITEPTADGTCIVTLDDIPNYIQILDADDLGGVAYKIANSPDIPWEDIGDGWFVWYDTTSVYFESIFSKATYTGTYSLAAGTATSTAGIFTQLVAGVAQTETPVAQASWDDPCDGTGAMPVTNFSFGNVYQILFQWLGYGQITYSMENSATGRFTGVYKIKYTNSAGVPTVTEPNGFVHIGTLNNSTPDSQTFTGTTGGTPPDIDQVNDTFDINGHGFSDGNFLSYDTGGGTAIGGISTENYTQTFDGSDSLVVNVASDIIEISKHGFSHTEQVLYTASAAAIGGLTTATLYYVIKRNASKIQLATTKANAESYTAIDLTALGTGTTDKLAAKRFYVVNSNADDFKLSLTPGGSAINITDGSGSNQRLFEVVASPSYITVDGSSGSVVSGTTITFTSHGFSDYEALIYDNYSAGTDIGGLTNLGLYYVRDSAANTFALSSTRGGDAISLSTGTGVEHRFSVVGALSTASLATFTEGEDTITGQEYSASGRQQTTAAATTEYPMLAIFNKKEYNGLPNKNNIIIKDMSFGYSKVNAADKETTAEFRAYINPGISTTSSVFTDVDSGISVAEQSTLSATDSLIAGSGRRVLTNFISIGGNARTDVNFIISPGDMFVITGRSPSATAIVLDCACRWVEDL